MSNTGKITGKNAASTITIDGNIKWNGNEPSVVGPLTIDKNSIKGQLPIELVYFEAKEDGGKVYLNWMTATETNNSYFNVERSVNTFDWETIATIKGAGNSSSQLKYAASDENPKALNNLVYYQLKQVDFNGDYSLSKVVELNLHSATQTNVYPNPANDKLIVEGNNTTNLSFILYNCLGIKIETPSYASHTDKLIIDTSALKAGLYFLQINILGKTETKRLIIQ